MPTTLCIRDLASKTNSESLKYAFSAFGDVEEAIVINDLFGKMGFVTYSSEHEAQTAINEMNFKFLDGRIIQVDFNAAWHIKSSARVLPS